MLPQECSAIPRAVVRVVDAACASRLETRPPRQTTRTKLPSRSTASQSEDPPHSRFRSKTARKPGKGKGVCRVASARAEWYHLTILPMYESFGQNPPFLSNAMPTLWPPGRIACGMLAMEL